MVYEAASRVKPDLPDQVVVMDADGTRLWTFQVTGPDMQEGGFGFWLGDWDGDGLDEVFVNDQTHVNILKDAKVVERIEGHLIYVFDLVGDRRAEAVILTGIEPGMRMQVVTNKAPNPYPETARVPDARKTTPDMYNATRY